jgi:hypothetical protein
MNRSDIAPDAIAANAVSMMSRKELREIVADAVAKAVKEAGLDARRRQSPPKLGYSLKEAAAVASVGRTSLYLAIRRRELRARKKGARTIVLDRDLRRWLEDLPPSHA